MRTRQHKDVSTYRKLLEANPQPQISGKSFNLSHADKIETVYGSRTPFKNNYEVSN